MTKTYEFVVYDDDGAGVTSAITEYDRGAEGHLTYVGRAFLDADETRAVLDVLTDPALRAHLASLDRMIRASDTMMADVGRPR